MCPPERTVRLFTLKDLIQYQILIERPREHTWVLPYNVKEKYAIIFLVDDIALTSDSPAAYATGEPDKV